MGIATTLSLYIKYSIGGQLLPQNDSVSNLLIQIRSIVEQWHEMRQLWHATQIGVDPV